MSARRFESSGPLQGALAPPPDKSISHRAALLGAIGEGTTLVRGYLDAADTRSTLAAVGLLGAEVTERGESDRGIEVGIVGIGLLGPGAGAGADTVAIDVGNAGTLLRILPGWLAGQGTGAWSLDGDDSIRLRPVDRVVGPLEEMGGRLTAREGRLPPLLVEGAELQGIEYRLPVASAQVKSCVLLAGLVARGETSVVESAPSRDHTERMLRAAGADVTVAETGVPARDALERRIVVGPVERIEPGEIEIPGDFSSAAFPIVAAALVERSEVRIESVGLNPTRIGLLGILTRMGAAVEVEEEPISGGEPRGSIVVRHGPLSATRVTASEVPVAIDELPLVALLGCFAAGETVVEGAGELRHKESDRIGALVHGLRGLGAEIEERPDGFAVRGGDGIRGGTLDSRGDHRLAMLGAVAGLASRQGAVVEGIEAAAVSYPEFEADLARLAG